MIIDSIYGYTLIASLSVVMIISLWYCYKLLDRLYSVLEVVEMMRERLYVYTEHIESVYNMDTYTGDETIKHLLEHSKDMKDFCDNINFSFLPLPEEQDGETYEEEALES